MQRDGGSDDGRPALAAQRGVDRVYQPAEDSRLLADVVVERVGGGDRLLDVGTGSGYIGARARETGAEVVGLDFNPHACRQARVAGLPVVRGDLTSPFRAEVFDAVAFNPPYLPADPEVEWNDWMERALSGGPEGRAVVDAFLADVGRVLAPEGAAFLIVSTLTGPEAIRARGLESGLTVTELDRESYPFEELLVLGIEEELTEEEENAG